MISETEAGTILLLACKYSNALALGSYRDSQGEWFEFHRFVASLVSGKPRPYSLDMVSWIKEYRNRTGSALQEAKDAWDRGALMPEAKS